MSEKTKLVIYVLLKFFCVRLTRDLIKLIANVFCGDKLGQLNSLESW